jgi:4-amino-4-deoxy-L-arabinose transferase-like glycosyltransferase
MRAWRGASVRRRDVVVASLLLLLALAVRVAYVLHTKNFVARVDAASYNYLAATLAKGHGWGYGTSAYRPPGYPVFLAGVYLLVGIPHAVFTSARLVEAVLATLSAGLIGLMALQLAGRRVALIALAIAAVYVPLVLVGVSLMSESLFVVLTLAATNCALRARAAMHRYRWVVLAGVFAGMAALTRGNGIVLGLALAIVVWPNKPRLSWRSAIAPLVLLLVMAMTIAPWTIRNANVQHAFVPVTNELGNTLKGTYNDFSAKHRFVWEPYTAPNYAAIQKNPHFTEAQRNSHLTSAVLTYISHHPASVPEAMFWNTLRLLDLQGRRVSRTTAYADTFATAGLADFGVVSFWIVAALAIVGAFTPAAKRVPRALWLVPLLLWLSIAPITTGTPRFRAAIDPFVILLAGFAIHAIAMRSRRRTAGLTSSPA